MFDNIRIRTKGLHANRPMNESNNLIYNKLIFTIALSMIILRKYLTTLISNPSVEVVLIQSTLFYIAIGLLVVLFIMDGNKKHLEIFIIIACTIIYIFNKNGTILMLVLLAMSIKHLDDNYVVKNYLIISVIFLCVFILLFNLFPELQTNNTVSYKYVSGNSAPVPRLDFGLGNPNSAFFFMITIFCAYIFLRFKSYNLLDRVIIIIPTVMVYIITSSRTGFYTIVAGLIFVEIIKYVDIKNKKWLSFLAKFSPLILSVMSVLIGTIFYKDAILNSLLSGRPKYWHVYLVEEGNFLKLFGNSYSGLIKSLNPLDSSYIYIIAMLGTVTFVLFLVLMYAGIDFFIKNDKKKYLVILSIFLIYSFAENIFFEAASNFGLVLLIKMLIVNNRGETNIYKILKR